MSRIDICSYEYWNEYFEYELQEWDEIENA